MPLMRHEELHAKIVADVQRGRALRKAAQELNPSLTKKENEARRRVWAQVRASLEIALYGNHPWLHQTRAPECAPLSKSDADLMRKIAVEVLAELRDREHNIGE